MKFADLSDEAKARARAHFREVAPGLAESVDRALYAYFAQFGISHPVLRYRLGDPRGDFVHIYATVPLGSLSRATETDYEGPPYIADYRAFEESLESLQSCGPRALAIVANHIDLVIDGDADPKVLKEAEQRASDLIEHLCWGAVDVAKLTMSAYHRPDAIERRLNQSDFDEAGKVLRVGGLES